MGDLQAKIDAFEAWATNNGIKKPIEVKVTKLSENNTALIFDGDVNVARKYLKHDLVPTSEDGDDRPVKKQRSDEGTIMLDLWIPFKLLFHPHFQSDLTNPLREELVKKFPEIFSVKSVGHQSHLVVQNSSNLQINSELVLAYWAFIKESRKVDSLWKPYIDMIPKSFDSTIYWTDAELEEIKGTNLYEGTVQVNLLLDYVTNLLRQVDPLITIDEVKWVHTLYASRSFGVKTKPKSMQQHEQPELNQNVFEKGQVEDTTNLYYDEDDEGTVPCLVPYGDSMNHHADVHAHFSAVKSSDSLFFEVTYDPIKQGNQVCSNYGSKSNEALMLSYGFIMENNDHNTYWLQIGIHQNDPFRQEKIRLLRSKKLGLRHHMTKNAIPESLFGAMRICLMNEDELYFYTASSDVISVRNELLVYSTLLDLLKTRLQRINRSTNEEDENLLKNMDLPYRTRMAVQYRLEQRQILQDATRLVTAKQDKYLQSLSASKEFQPRTNFVFPLWEMMDQTKLMQWQNKFVKKESNGDNTLFEIPSQYLISVETVMGTSFGELIAQNDIELDPEILIALFLVKQKNTNSIWQEYLDLFPARIPNTLFLEDSELEMLGDTPLAIDARELQEDLEQQFSVVDAIKQEIPELFDEQYTLESFKWAYSLVQMMAERFPKKVKRFEHDQEYEEFVVQLTWIPVFPPHLFNEHCALIYNYDNSDNLQLKSSIPINYLQSQGETYISNFGGRDNSLLMLHFGAVLLGNPQDTFPIDIDMPEDLGGKMQQIVRERMLSPSNKLRQNTLSPKLIQMLRVCYTDEDQVDSLTDLDDITSSADVLNNLKGMLEGIADSLGLSEAKQEEEQKVQNNEFENSVHKAIVYYKRSLHKLLEKNIQLVASAVKDAK